MIVNKQLMSCDTPLVQNGMRNVQGNCPGWKVQWWGMSAETVQDAMSRRGLSEEEKSEAMSRANL